MSSVDTSGRPTAPVRRWLAIGLGIGLLLTALAPPASAGTRPLVTGISGLYEHSPLAFQQVRSTGARLIRISVYWPGIAPGEQPSRWQPENPADPHYEWAHTDNGVRGAIEAGLTPVLLIDGAPTWAQRCRAPAGFEDAICDPDPAALAAFATAAARRYSGSFGPPKVTYWGGINEPNLSVFFLPQLDADGKSISPLLYRRLLIALSGAVKSVDPLNQVLAGGLSPIEVRPWAIGPMRFTRELLCMRGPRAPRPAPGSCEGPLPFDIFDIHPYTTGGPTHTAGINDVQLGDLSKLQALLGAAARAGRIESLSRPPQLWSTEFSWDSNPPDPGGLGMGVLTRWTAEALHRAWRAGMTRFFWYGLEDSKPDPSRAFSATLESGLFFRGAARELNHPKQVLSAFRFPFVSYPRKRGLFFWGRTPDSAPGKVTIQVRTGRRWRSVTTARADRSGIFTGTAEVGYGRNRRGAVRAVSRGQAATPFSMRPVADFRQRPFG